MTAYNFRAIPPSPAQATHEKKEQRRRVLEAVFARRRQNYLRYRAAFQKRLKQGKQSLLFE